MNTTTMIPVLGVEHAFRVFGDGPVQAVVLTALGSLQAEWWPFCESISGRAAVLTYDRAGYGQSQAAQAPRTPGNIVLELKTLLDALGVTGPVTLVGHSQGGLYAALFTKRFPEKVRAILLMDPLSPRDDRFRDELAPQEYKQSGVDKSFQLKSGNIVTSLGLGFLLKPMLRKGPPFYYYSDYPKEAADYILRALTRPKGYRTALAEYQLSHEPQHLDALGGPGEFPNVPMSLITHDSAVSEEEIVTYGGASRDTAEKVERIWQEVMKEYLSFSNRAAHVVSKGSGHYIHLSDPALVSEHLFRLTTDG